MKEFVFFCLGSCKPRRLVIFELLPPPVAEESQDEQIGNLPNSLCSTVLLGLIRIMS